MDIDVIIIQFALGTLLFFIINWIGRHSYSIGYMEISMFLKVEEAPAFNFLFIILGPIVYIFILSAIFYNFELERYVKNIYLISIYYISFRLIFNLLTNRGLLLNWGRQFLQWIAIISICYFGYSKIIINRTNLLPDFNSLSNELWIIILIFLFQVLNGIRISSENTIKRKRRYILQRYNFFYHKYQKLLDVKISDKKLQALVYAIMIYEDFNRPKAARLIENIRFIISKKEHSLGVMQVKSSKLINDKESVSLGIDKIVASFNNQIPKILKEKKEQVKENKLRTKAIFNQTGYMMPELNDSEENISIEDYELVNAILNDYNPDYDYVYEVKELHDQIIEIFDYDNNFISLTKQGTPL